jgi:hypothetical protein
MTFQLWCVHESKLIQNVDIKPSFSTNDGLLFHILHTTPQDPSSPMHSCVLLPEGEAEITWRLAEIQGTETEMVPGSFLW